MGAMRMDGCLGVDGWVLVIWMDAMGTDGCYEDECWQYGWMLWEWMLEYGWMNPGGRWVCG